MPSTLTYANRRGKEIVNTIHDYDNETDLDDSTHGSLSSDEDELLYFDDPTDSDDDESTTDSDNNDDDNQNDDIEPPSD
eukprot:8381379-Ditylum_brightwellii.AAC.1